MTSTSLNKLLSNYMKIFIIICSILLLIYPSNVFSQKVYAIDKGSIIIGERLGYTSTGNEYRLVDRIQTLTICPGCLLFIIPHLAIGGELKLINTTYSEYYETSYGIGPSIAFYFGKKNDKEYPFLSFSYLRIEESGTYWRPNRSEYCFTGGVAFMIARNVAIEPRVFFSIANIKDQKDSNTFGIEMGISSFVF